MGMNETGTITLKILAQDLASGNVGKFIGNIDRMAKQGGIAGSIFQGIGQSFGQMLNPMALATRGIGMMTDFLTDATKAAIEDEKSQARLTQTLINNVEGWGAYGGAIDQATDDALALAFADDEVRASLNLLLPRTKDVTEAIRLNALAMDLARFKGMSLEEATTLVGKAYSGQVSALRRAGIAITETKDSTKALAELQKAVAGQASTYAQTAEGSYKTLELTVQELTESIGYELLPTLKDFATYVRTDVIPNIDEWVHSLQDAFHWTAATAKIASGDILGAIKEINQLMDREIRTFNVPAPGTIRFFDPIPKAAGMAVGETADELRRLPGIAGEATWNMTQGIVAAVKSGIPDVKSVMKDLRWAIEHPMALAATRAEIKGALTSKRLAKGIRSNNVLVRQAAIDARAALLTQWNALPSKAMELGRLTIRELVRGLNEGERYALGVYGTTGGGGGGKRPPTGDTAGHNAAGTDYWRGGWSWVGEEGRELVNLPRGSSVLSNPESERAASAIGGGSVHLHFHGMVAAPSEADGQRIARQLVPTIRREMARAGG